jgi:starch phosphorylase
LTVTVPIRGSEVSAQIWRVAVGRVPLFLLDTDRPENRRLERWIGSQLYVGDPMSACRSMRCLVLAGCALSARLGSSRRSCT